MEVVHTFRALHDSIIKIAYVSAVFRTDIPYAPGKVIELPCKFFYLNRIVI